MSEKERMTATLQTLDGEFVQVSDYAATFAEMEQRVTEQYSMSGKLPAGSQTYGAVILRIVRDSLANQLPAHEHVGD